MESPNVYCLDPQYPFRVIRTGKIKANFYIEYPRDAMRWSWLTKTIDDALEKRQFDVFCAILNQYRVSEVDDVFFYRFSEIEMIKHFSLGIFRNRRPFYGRQQEPPHITQISGIQIPEKHRRLCQEWLVKDSTWRRVVGSMLKPRIPDEIFKIAFQDIVKYMKRYDLLNILYAEGDFLRNALVLDETTEEPISASRLAVFRRVNQLIQALDPYLIRDGGMPLYLAGYYLIGDYFSGFDDETLADTMGTDRFSFFRSSFCDFGSKPKWSPEIHLRCPKVFRAQAFALLCISRCKTSTFPLGKDLLYYLLSFVLSNSFDLEIENAALSSSIIEGYTKLDDQEFDELCLRNIVCPFSVSIKLYCYTRWYVAFELFKSITRSKFDPIGFSHHIANDDDYILTWPESVIRKIIEIAEGANKLYFGTDGGRSSIPFSMDALRKTLRTKDPRHTYERWQLACYIFLIRCIEDGLDLQDVKEGKIHPNHRNNEFLKRKYLESTQKRQKL